MCLEAPTRYAVGQYHVLEAILDQTLLHREFRCERVDLRSSGMLVKQNKDRTSLLIDVEKTAEKFLAKIKKDPVSSDAEPRY